MRVLDGGLGAWRSVGGPVTTELPEPRAGTFEAHAGGMSVVDAAGAAQVARDGILLDARAAERFRGDAEPEAEVKIELPIEAHLPHDYVPSERLRLEMYKRLADLRSLDEVAELRAELVDRYGEPPVSTESLLEVARLRVRVRAAGLTEVTSAGPNIRFSPVKIPESAQLRLARIYPKSRYKAAAEVALVPRPKTAAIGGESLRDSALLEWCRKVIDTVIDPA